MKYISTVNYNYSTLYAVCEIAISFNTCTWAYVCCDTRSVEFKMENVCLCMSLIKITLSQYFTNLIF